MEIDLEKMAKQLKQQDKKHSAQLSIAITCCIVALSLSFQTVSW